MSDIISKIEQKTDLAVVRSMPLSTALRFVSMGEVMEFAKVMAATTMPGSVPAHCVGNVSMCLAVCVQAMEWEMSPFQVARKSYVVNGVLAFEAQLIAAVAVRRAPIMARFRYEFLGEGLDMQCKVTAQFRDEIGFQEYISPKIRDISPRNSPLWKSDQQQQLGYYSVRAWVRRHCPDVLLGIYAPDEIDPTINMRTINNGHQDFKKVTNPLNDAPPAEQQPIMRYWYDPESESLWESADIEANANELSRERYEEMLAEAEKEIRLKEGAEAQDDANFKDIQEAMREQQEEAEARLRAIDKPARLKPEGSPMMHRDQERTEATKAEADRLVAQARAQAAKAEAAAKQAPPIDRKAAGEPKAAHATEVAPHAKTSPAASQANGSGNAFLQEALAIVANAVDGGRLNRWWRETRKTRMDAGLTNAELNNLTQTYNEKFIQLQGV